MNSNKQNIVVLGGAESGCGSAILAQKLGYSVFLSDNGTIPTQYRELLDKYSIEYEQGGHTVERIMAADVVVKSPGIPDHIDLIKNLRSQSISVISELEFAKPHSSAKCIAITGSNGKTTITTLVYEILKRAGYSVGLAGNIGKSYAMQVAFDNYDWYVIEVSSFQLDGMYDFRSDISILSNITPDHLDRYDYNMQNYINSKFRVCQNHTPEQHFIYSIDDTEIKNYLDHINIASNHLPYSVKRTDTNGSLIDDMIVVQYGQSVVEIPRSAIQLSGLHNISNIMGASLAALVAGVEPTTIVDSVESFGGVEHRVERVALDRDILYINDSKATNVDAVWYALEGMTRPVVWIAGGKDKGNDYSPLKELAAERVHTLICMGVDNSKLLAAFGGVVPNIISTGSLDEAIDAVRDSAKAGDVVLLSPACASFDLFTSYENRGELFKQSIKQLISREDGQ